MEHSSYKMKTGIVTLHQTTDYDDKDMKDMEGEDWIDLSILDAEMKLDIGNMDSEVVLDHDNGASTGSLTTRAYTNNNMAGVVDQNGKTVVSSFMATKK